jgi:uncharacterized membrane protein affecting hemolysin expression
MMLWPVGSRALKILLQNKSVSYLLLTCTLCLLTSFGGLWLINYSSQQQQQQFISSHGQIINKLTANQLATRMASRDLIGMQSLLQRLAQQKSIVNAVIYDVNNQVVVQAGTVSGVSVLSYRSFTTPIAIDNSLLGSLTTTVNIEFKTDNWLLLVVIVGSLSPFILLSRYLIKSNLILKPAISHPANAIHKPAAATIQTKATQTYGLLLIQIYDLDKISKQLNAQSREKEFATLDKLLNDSLSLYSGEKIALNQSCIVLKFTDEDKDKYVFNATCCAYLLLEAAKKMRLFLKLSATLYSSSNTISLQQEIPQLVHLSYADRILINDIDLNYRLLKERLIFEAIEKSHFIKVTGFSDSYQKLLDNQLRYLLSTH